MAHRELDLIERQIIEDMLLAKAPVAKIAGKLSRHRSTIYREIARNSFTDDEMPDRSGSTSTEPHRKPLHLPLAQPQDHRRFARRPATVDHLRQNLHAIEFPLAHHHPSHVGLPFRTGEG